MIMEGTELVSLALWVCSIVGTLFVIYSFAIFIRSTLDNALRLGLSFLFLLTGGLFFSSVGSILTGKVLQFTIVSLTIAIILAIIGMILVYLMYKPEKANIEEVVNGNDKLKE